MKFTDNLINCTTWDFHYQATIQKLINYIQSQHYVQLLNKLFNIDLQEGYGKAFGFLVATQIKKVEEMLKETMNIEWVHLLHAVELHKVNDNDFKSTENLIEHRSMRQLTEFQIL